MKILVTGAKGMLGRTLLRILGREHSIFPADLPETDILDEKTLDAAFAAFKPDAAVHCAAFTNVDRCESEPEAAFRLNRDGTGNVARACAKHSSRLVAISTDYVFGGDSDVPYRESDRPAPRTVYGKSKLAGEEEALAALPSAAILRIAWLYGAGGPSFVHTMAKLGAAGGPPLKVVDDQRGNPTSCEAVASAVSFILGRGIEGVVHGTCEGICSWFHLARETFSLLGIGRAVAPCTTAEFPRPAPRPANSALENTVLAGAGFEMPHWKDALKEFARNEFSRP